MILLFTYWVVLTFSTCHSYDAVKNKLCYQARTCIHTGRERCGMNSGGVVRRFLDSCDILEFNCLRGTDFIKTTYDKCENQPPIDEQVDNFNHTVKLVDDDKQAHLKFEIDNTVDATVTDGGTTDGGTTDGGLTNADAETTDEGLKIPDNDATFDGDKTDITATETTVGVTEKTSLNENIRRQATDESSEASSEEK